MTSVSSDELAARVHEQLSKMDVRPTQIISESAKNLRPQFRRGKKGKYSVIVSDSSVGESFSSSSSLSSSSSVSRSSEQPGFVERYFGWFDWKIGLALVVVTIIVVFVYKKWYVIKNLGVGYAVADVGLEKVGSSLSGTPPEQMAGELDALKNGSHPILPSEDEGDGDGDGEDEDEAGGTKRLRRRRADVHFADEKDALIERMISQAVVVDEEEDSIPPPPTEDEAEEESEAKGAREAEAEGSEAEDEQSA